MKIHGLDFQYEDCHYETVIFKAGEDIVGSLVGLLLTGIAFLIFARLLRFSLRDQCSIHDTRWKEWTPVQVLQIPHDGCRGRRNEERPYGTK